MKVTLWGTRGSLPAPGPDTVRYGGNTTCVEVTAADGTTLVLDAGSGIRRLGMRLVSYPCVHLFLTHLHMDHILGLGFFAPFRRPGTEAHIWGPRSATLSLHERLTRYLSPPLFPVRIPELEASIHFHQLSGDPIEIGPFVVSSMFILHPDHTVGYRIEEGGRVFTFMPDHEPALGAHASWPRGDWVSGCSLASGADLLVHDAQYTHEQYRRRVGWGHSSMEDACRFAQLAAVKELVLFHHDPTHTDDELDWMISTVLDKIRPSFLVQAGMEGMTFDLT